MKRIFLLFLLMGSALAMMAQRTVTGVVTEDSGEGLIGANVLVKGTDVGTITDIDGSFSIEVPGGSNILVFSFTGFENKEMDITGMSEVSVILSEGQLLDEVVITGYTAQSTRQSAASIATISSDAIGAQPVTNLNAALQGQAPGVFTTAASGQPGAGQAIRIRGTGSITAGRTPLYVIDGVIIEQGNKSQLDGANATDVLSQLNPNDIESVNILKDASATSLYGSRGSNGVIVINTKRGKAGATKFSARGQYGVIQQNTGNFQVMTAQQQWEYERQVLANSGFDQATIDGIRPASLLDNTTDWVDAAFREANLYNVELQAQGGNENTRFFASGGYQNTEGTLIESNFDLASLRVNLDNDATDKLSFSLNLNGSYSRQNNAVSGNRFQSPLLGAFLNTPLQGSTDPETGDLLTGLEDDWLPFVGDNFLYSQPLNPVQINTFRLLSKLQMNYKILDNLTFSQTGSIDFYGIDEGDYDDPTTNDGVNEGGSLTNSYTNDQTITTQSSLRYFTDIAEDHAISALGVFEYQRFNSNSFSATGQGFASGKLQTLNSAATPFGVGGFESNYSFLSLIGQLDYSFMSRYNVVFGFRRDGSSRFGANNRWANFGSVGVSWLVSEEAFLADNSIINLLKFKGSYGTTGNAAIGNFPSQELYGFGAAYRGIPGSTPSQIANPDLTWEQARTLNVGVEFGLFKSNRVSGSVEYYRRVSTDLLLNVPVSSTSGFTTALRNVGEVENSGIEITTSLIPVMSNDPNGFTWSIDGNISFNRNKILSLPDGEDQLNGSQIFREGEPIRSFYMERWAGVNPADGSPLWYTADDDENQAGVTGTYRDADRFIVGNAEPDFIAGLTNTISYKGFTLSALLYTAQGNEIYNSSRRFIESDGQRFGWNHVVESFDAWAQPGDVSGRPLPVVGGNNAANSRSTRYLEDASFIRLRNLQLNYRLPSGVANDIGIGGATFFLQGQNLFTITDYSGFDPEANESGVEFFRYPVAKTITFGLDFTF